MSRKQITFEQVRADFATYSQHIQANRHPISLLLDDIQDVRNVGALFRLADGARLDKIYTYGTPVDVADKKLHRIARATETSIPYQHLENLAALQALQTQKPLIGLEWTNDSIPYTAYTPEASGCILVLGNEERGISNEVLPLLDSCIHLPMYGINTSLNVAMAAGIAVYGILERLLSS